MMSGSFTIILLVIICVLLNFLIIRPVKQLCTNIEKLAEQETPVVEETPVEQEPVVEPELAVEEKPAIEEEPAVEEETSSPEATQESSFASFAFALPKRRDVCILSIYRVIGDERIEVIEAQEISPGTSSFFLDLTGTGTHIYEVYIDGELYKTQEVVFT